MAVYYIAFLTIITIATAKQYRNVLYGHGTFKRPWSHGLTNLLKY